MTSAARFDLAALLAALIVTRGEDGRVTVHFAYPSSPHGHLRVRHVHQPVLLHTSRGWVLRGTDAARGGRVRTFRVERITGRDDTTLPPRRQHTAGGHAEGGDHERGRRPHPPPPTGALTA